MQYKSSLLLQLLAVCLMLFFSGLQARHLLDTVDNGEVKDLESGKPKPLEVKGLIRGSQDAINFNTQKTYDLGSFQVVREDSKGKNYDGQLSQQVLTNQLKQKLRFSKGTELRELGTDGKKLNSKTWSDDVTIVEVNTGEEGTIGLQIPFNKLKDDKPIVVSSGKLTGCLFTYAADKDNLYVFHTGKADSSKEEWNTCQQGVVSVNYAQHFFKTKDIHFAEPGKNKYSDLPSIFDNKNYQNAFFAYRGKDDKNDINGGHYISQLNYGKPTDQSYAYALVAKHGGKVSVNIVSEKSKNEGNKVELIKQNGKEVKTYVKFDV